MASRSENLKSLFSNTRSRVIIIFTLILLVLIISIGFMKFRTATSMGVPALSSGLSGTPGIQSIPGALNQTAQYAKLQEQQNVQQAQVAAKSGNSAIPTIIRAQAIGPGVGVIGKSGGVGFVSLDRENGYSKEAWEQNVANEHCSRASIQDAINQGAQLSDLSSACTCLQFKAAGYSLSALQNTCDCKGLKAAGYSAKDLKKIGYSAKRLKRCGFSACALFDAGFTAQELKDAGFTDDELRGAGFTEKQIEAANGLPPGVTFSEVQKAGCNVAALEKLRAAGVSAGEIRKTNGC
ncbi:MAG: type IV secretion protein IcmE, partial [Legionellaceae bacterium]|nr:type IV secretion protein IcmE [Legionellaceae bacterium]